VTLRVRWVRDLLRPGEEWLLIQNRLRRDRVFRQGTRSLLMGALTSIMSRKAVGRRNTASPKRRNRQYWILQYHR
jgi:hypothetical protein